MKTTIITLIFASISIFGFAQKKNKKMVFEVDGKCDMCKMRIEKAALGVSGVKFASWDIPTHQLSLILDERKTNTMQVKTALAEAGHDSKELKATKKSYDNLHACCKYRDDEADDSHEHHR